MPYIVHSRVERGYTSESVFRIRCIAHGLYLVTKSALLNSCARNDSHTTEEHASNISELRHVPPGNEPSICEHNRVKTPNSIHLHMAVCL
jgi:hypothetical protein